MQEMKRVQHECSDSGLDDDERKLKAEQMMLKFSALMGMNESDSD
jgi:ribosomal protein L29